ncbi:MAG: glutamate racemase [Candidatus Omnitrophica bacterium]|nr:glutamate racemase [Candidatus Omnitrophota bacterium]
MKIGVFDSGIGGLTVVKQLLKLSAQEMPQIVYFGDTARVPYGTKSAATVIKFTQEIMEFLLRFEVNEVVVACHTASSLALASLKDSSPVPVRGVIQPGVKQAVALTRKRKIGVIGTSSTISSNAYGKELAAVAPEIELISKSCPLFVPLAEEGWLDDSISRQVAHRYLDPLVALGIDVLVLGCTHYPLLKGIIKEVAGRDITVVDSAYAVAGEIGKDYRLSYTNDDTWKTRVNNCRFYVSDEPRRFQDTGEKFLGTTIRAVEKVEIERYIVNR